MTENESKRLALEERRARLQSEINILETKIGVLDHQIEALKKVEYRVQVKEHHKFTLANDYVFHTLTDANIHLERLAAANPDKEYKVKETRI